MQRAKPAGLTFLLTLGVIWIPWVIWFAIDAYLLGHSDAKFGRDGGFVFGVYLRGITAGVSAAIVAATHLVEMLRPNPLQWSTRRGVIMLGGAVLCALSPLVPHLSVVPGVDDVFGLVVAWALVSLLAAVGMVALAAWGVAWASRRLRAAAQQADAADEAGGSS